jgi:hypothetical protein
MKRGSQFSLSGDRGIEVRSMYQLRIDKLKGVSARTSLMIQRDFCVDDRIGALISSIVTTPGNLSRFLNMQHPCAMVRTLANIALMEKLEAATPEALVAELTAGQHASQKGSTHHINTLPSRSRSTSPVSRNTRSPDPDHAGSNQPAHISPQNEPAQPASRARSRTLRNAPGAAQLAAHHGHAPAALAAEGILKINALRTRIPVRAAGLTVGSFRHIHDRTATLVPTDDGTAAGGARVRTAPPTKSPRHRESESFSPTVIP